MGTGSPRAVPFRCPQCHAALEVPVTAEGEIKCVECSTTYLCSNGVPLFLTEDTGEVLRGLAGRSFRTPKAYRWVVERKTQAQKLLGREDARIGIEDLVRDQHVLDVGCGPELDLPSAENHHATAATYTGIDVSVPFVLAARAQHPEPRYRFAQASVTDLPFPDDSFDTVLVSFTIHHVEADAADILVELTRVARRNVVIYDHLRADGAVLGRVQGAYWRLFDGGCNYMTASQWERCLAGVNVERQVRTGAIGGHVTKIVCTVPQGT